jgi:hypothetical protein
MFLRTFTAIIFLFLFAFASFSQASFPVQIQLPNTALYFPQNEAETLSVNHGQFWIPGKEYDKFFVQAQVYPEDKKSSAVGSIITSGYGGYHALQLSITGCDNGVTYIYGSFNFDYSQHIAVYSQSLPCGQWHDIAFGYDGTFVNVWVDGIPSPNLLYVNGVKRRVGYTYETSLNIGGSGHSGCGCFIRQVRLFEGQFPLDSVSAAFNPESTYVNDYLIYKFPYLERIQADFLADYSRNCDTSDLSSGFEGSTHRGKFLKQAGNFEYNLFGMIGKSYEVNAAKCYDFNN